MTAQLLMSSQKLGGEESRSGIAKGFASLEDEVSIDSLRVEGRLPAWLAGALVRNGPAKFEVGTQRYRHWFDGLAMLHMFSFRGGKVSYANRFLKSNAYNRARETGKISYREFATDPCRSIFSRIQSMFSQNYGFTDNANVNVATLGNKFIAMTETPLSVEFDPKSLETLGVHKGEGVSGQVTTAHPQYDFERRQAVNYITRMSARSWYRVYRIPEGTTIRQQIGSFGVQEPAYMHSFAMTAKYVILAEYPFVVRPIEIPLGGRPFIENFRWKPERGTRFIVLRKDDGRVEGTYESGPFFAFHHINAFERADEIVIDIAAYNDPSIVRSLYLDVLRGSTPTEFSTACPRRYRISLKERRVSEELLSKEAIELPRINYREFNTREYRFAYGIGAYGPNDFGGKLVKLDVNEGLSLEWSGTGCHGGEPVFVKRPDGTSEDDGVLLSVVLDTTKGNSFLLVLDAKSFAEIARAEVPHHIPFGFHGQFYSS